MTTDPAARTYSETWAGRGVPMDELAAFVARAVDAGAPLTARIRLEDADRNILLGLRAPGTRMSVTWPYRPRPAAPSLHAGAYDETEQVIALEDARYRQERAKGGVVDTSRLVLIGEREGEQLDYRTHADPPPPDEDDTATPADPWPFKAGDVVDDIGGAITEWLDAAPEGTVVVVVVDDAEGDEWEHHKEHWCSHSLHLVELLTSSELAAEGTLKVVRVGKGDR